MTMISTPVLCAIIEGKLRYHNPGTPTEYAELAKSIATLYMAVKAEVEKREMSL
jgi:hypothetical protein